jgi:sortase A
VTGEDRGYDPLYDPLPDEFYTQGRREADRHETYGEPDRQQYPSSGGAEPYGARDDYRAAVDALNDPLNDPLPSSPSSASATGTGGGAAETSPWFGAGPTTPAPRPEQPAQQPQQPQHGPAGGPPYAGPHAGPPRPGGPGPDAYGRPPETPGRPPGAGIPGGPTGARQDVGETAAMPAVDDAAGPSRTLSVDAADDDHTMALRTDDDPILSTGGRAARRKAARGHGRGADAAAEESATTPHSRLEARRAARAAKDGPVVLLSRFIGEVFITCGVLMLLFVTYQLWWTNVQAHESADSAANSLVQKWKDHPSRKPGAFDPGQGFAIMYIPKLDVRAPIAQGVDKQKILDKGLIGHYDKSSGIPTAMPWDKTGNFAVAAHRNTHGEPFRYINRLVAGDKIIVETADTYYTYEMYSRLPSTPPSNTSVIDPVPPESGFTKPGRYITLTTCTPEFTSRYRLIVWGKMVDERPRSEGKPDALIR